MTETELTHTCFGFVPEEERRSFNTICKARFDGCPGAYHCPFFKSAKKAWADRQDAFRHIKKLPFHEQSAIADKYYSGDMPWLDVREETQDAEV